MPDTRKAQARGSSVVILQRVLRAYRVPFYEHLKPALESLNIDLRLVHSHPPIAEDVRRNPGYVRWAERRSIYGGSPASSRPLWQPGLDLLRTADLVIVEQAARLLFNYAALAAYRVGGPSIALWGHGRDHRDEGVLELAHKGKTWMSKAPHWWFAYTQQGARDVAALGFPSGRITVVGNATDSREIARLVDKVTPDQLARSREELGTKSDNIGIFIGSLHEDKRLPFLFEAAHILREHVDDFHLVIAGAGDLEELVQQEVRSHPWMHYVGFRHSNTMAPLLRQAKVALVPGWVGLVVVDCFAAGLPLVASASGPHPPEATYIKNGVNGLMVNDGGHAHKYASAVAGLLLDESVRQPLIEGARISGERLTIEAMTDSFTQGIRAALVAPPRYRLGRIV